MLSTGKIGTRGRRTTLSRRPKWAQVNSKTGTWAHDTLWKAKQRRGVIPFRVEPDDNVLHPSEEAPADRRDRVKPKPRKNANDDNKNKVIVSAFTVSGPDPLIIPARSVITKPSVDVVLGFAITFHKCQGDTLGKLVTNMILDLSMNPIRSLKLSMIYVGLTRVTAGGTSASCRWWSPTCVLAVLSRRGDGNSLALPELL